MDKNKQIEEMANIMRDTENVCQATQCPNCNYQNCDYTICIHMLAAETIYNAGYRKASEIFEQIEKHFVTGCTFYGQAIHSIGVGTFAKLKKEYVEGIK